MDYTDMTEPQLETVLAALRGELDDGELASLIGEMEEALALVREAHKQ